MSRMMAAAAHGRAPDGTVDRSVLIEAVALSNDACFDVAAHARRGPFGGTAPDRGRVRVDLGGLSPSGVEKVDVATVAPDELEPTTSAAHAHVAELAGAKTLAIAFRGTDEGDKEFAFQGGTADGGQTFGWDAYAAAHAPLVVAGLQYAADPSNGIERILLTGHSLGGVVAEQLTQALVAPSPLADVAQTITFGQPGSRGEGQDSAIFNVVHSDDFIARLSDLSPLFAFFGLAREGTDAVVARPEATLPDFAPQDLDSPEEIYAAGTNPAFQVEHRLVLYRDTAVLLDEAEAIVPGVSDALDDPERRLLLPEDVGFQVGTARNDELPVTAGATEVLLGGAGRDTLEGDGGPTCSPAAAVAIGSMPAPATT